MTCTVFECPFYLVCLTPVTSLGVLRCSKCQDIVLEGYWFPIKDEVEILEFGRLYKFHYVSVDCPLPPSPGRSRFPGEFEYEKHIEICNVCQYKHLANAGFGFLGSASDIDEGSEL
jgi:hypothetical protein